LPVGEIMSSDLACCSPGDDMGAALSKMAERHVQRLPVVSEDGALAGILSIDDLVLRAETDVSKNDVFGAMKSIYARQSHRKGGSLAPAKQSPAAA
jgi:CBS domain-containing protein